MLSLLQRTPSLDRTTRPTPARRAWGLAAVIIVVGLALASSAAAITYVGERGTLSINNGSGLTQAISVASSATAGNTVILVFTARDTSTAGVSVADSKGNTWTIDGNGNVPLNNSNDFVFIASTRQNVGTLVTGNTVTVTFGTAPNSSRAAILEEFSGLQTSAGYVDVSNSATAGGTPYVSGTTATTTQASELAVTGFSLNHVAGNTITLDGTYSSFTTSTIQPGTTDAYQKDLAAQYKILSSTGAQSSTITDSANSSYQGMIVTYKAGCAAPSDAAYVAANAQPTQAIVYWSSANPVVILEKSGSAITDVPTNGTTYSAGQTIGASTVKFAGSGTSYTRTGLTNGTVYYYKVFANSSACYSPGGTGSQVVARPVAGPSPAWDYNLAGGSMLVAGIAGTGTLYTGSNADQIVGLSTANGTQLWPPVATTQPIQAWLTWLPITTYAAWPYRKAITINQVTATLTNFPVLLSFTDTNLQTYAQASGNDIFFTAADGVTKLNHEVEYYNAGQLIAWVQVPSLSSTSTTVIYMYYGNAAASNQQNATGTWNDGYYKAVWHLKESGNGTAGEFKDSTGVNNGQGGAGTLATTPTQATGEIGFGQTFNGTSQYIQVPNNASLNVTTQLTMEAWVNVTNPGNDQKVVGMTPIGSGYLLAVRGGGLTPEIWDSAGVDTSNTWGTITANTWTHLVVTWTTNGTMNGYVNGVQYTMAATANNIGTTTNVLRIGTTPWSNPPTQFFVAGLIDEVRISNTARSAAWITTEYANQSSPSTFYSVGPQLANNSSSSVVLGADQSGRVYSVDGGAGSSLWQVTPGDLFQAPVAAQLQQWSNSAFQTQYSYDLLFVPTRNASTTTNKLYALNRSTGGTAWSFNGTVSTGNSMDIIVGMPWVDYARNYVYVVSRANGGIAQPSLWVINSLTGAKVASWNLNDIDASPTMSMEGNTLYVATNGGNLYAFNMSTLSYKWNSPYYAALGSAVKGFIWEDPNTVGRLYFSTPTSGYVWCLQDPGSGQAPPSVTTASCTGWSAVKTAVTGPSTPLPLASSLYVGSSDGTVHKLNLSNGQAASVNPTTTIGDGTKQVGDVSTETGNEIFVGTTEGTLYKLSPLP
ncbi:MAG: DUF2341 domain-containing protein [Candidatus Methylomirabilales bacterium]